MVVIFNLTVACLGNLIFEMATGRELDGVIPTKAEYNCVTKELNNVFKNIFDGDLTLEEVRLCTNKYLLYNYYVIFNR